MKIERVKNMSSVSVREESIQFNLAFQVTAIVALAHIFNGDVSAADEAHNQKITSLLRGEYKLVRSEEIGYSMCREFTENLSEASDIDFDVCASRLSVKYPRFMRISWEEMPFDLSVAEIVVKSGLVTSNAKKREAIWKEWLNSTESTREAGKVKLWSARADLAGAGKVETIIRMNDGLSSKLFGGVQGCVDRDSSLHLENGEVEFARRFNIIGSNGDLIRDGETGKFFIVSSSNYPGVGIGIWGKSHPVVVANATRGIAIYEVKATHGPIAVCNIQWVPSKELSQEGDKK